MRACMRQIGQLALALAVACSFTHCSRKGDAQKVEVQIDGDSSHSATVPLEDVEHGGVHTYVVHGKGHEHLFVLTDPNTRDLRDGKTVRTRTTSSEAHVHEVTVRLEP